MRPREPRDETVEAQAPQLVRHSPGWERVRGQAEQRPQGCPEFTVAPAIRQQAEDHQQTEQGLDDRVGEAQGGGPLPCDGHWLGDVSERRFADRAVVADPLDVQQTSVGLKADLPQGGEVRQPLADLEVVRVVDRGLRPECPALLVILLDPRVLVVDMERGRDALAARRL